MIAASLGFLAALFVGTLVEYAVHRYVLHTRRFTNYFVRRHKLHHKTYERHSLASEFAGFFPWAVPVLPLGFLFGVPAGVGFAAGTVVYVLWVALCHKWSHEAPHRLFWMSPNVHAVHHDHPPRWNFGVTTGFWDRVFGTYRELPEPAA